MKYYIDTNIFLYLQDAESSYYNQCAMFFETVEDDTNSLLVTSTETFQEIIHLFSRQKKRDSGIQKAMQAKNMVDLVLPVTDIDITEYFHLVNKYRTTPSRDLLHAAVCVTNGIKSICTFDNHFGQITEVDNIRPDSTE